LPALHPASNVSGFGGSPYGAPRFVLGDVDVSDAVRRTVETMERSERPPTANPVPDLARIFGLSIVDTYCLAVYVAASDETWTTDYVIHALSSSLAEAGGAREHHKPAIRDLVKRLQDEYAKPMKERVFPGIIGNIGWFVQGVACTVGKLPSLH
jgi:hypothetical protein